MEFFLFVKLAKVEILLIAMMALCFINGKKRTSGNCLIWPSLPSLLAIDKLSVVDVMKFPSSRKWQFTIKFGLIVHAGMCWRFAKTILSNYSENGSVFCCYAFSSHSIKAPVTVGACFISHLLLVIFTFNLNKRLKNIFYDLLMSLFELILVV